MLLLAQDSHVEKSLLQGLHLPHALCWGPRCHLGCSAQRGYLAGLLRPLPQRVGPRPRLRAGGECGRSGAGTRVSSVFILMMALAGPGAVPALSVSTACAGAVDGVLC